MDRLDLPLGFYPNLSMAIGQVVVSWAFTEQVLDSCVAIIFQSLDCKHIASEVPRSTDRKIEFLKSAIKTHRKLIRFQSDLASLSAAKTVVNIRHTVVHGVISQYDDSLGAMVFTMLDAKPRFHHVVEKKLTFKKLLSAGAECDRLTRELHDLAKRLLRALVPKSKSGGIVK